MRFFLTATILLAFSCSISWTPSEDVSLIFPELPAHAKDFGAPRFRIFWRDGEGRLRERETEGGETCLGVMLPARSSLPILAIPIIEDRSDLVLPAGGLYPHEVDCRGLLPLSWENGFAAGILVQAEGLGFPLDAFNAERFFREVRERGSGNPWNLNRERVLETLAGLAFRADRIVKAKTHILRIPGLQGDWFSWNPLLDPFSRDDAGEVVFGSFPPGFHRFYRSGEVRSRLDADIGEDGATVWREFSTW